MHFMWLSNAVVKNAISLEIYLISCFYSQINKLLSGVNYHQIQFHYVRHTEIQAAFNVGLNPLCPQDVSHMQHIQDFAL